MPRILIGSTAVSELRAVRPVASRRRVVARIVALDAPVREHGLCAPGRYRTIVDGLRVLSARRDDGTLVVAGIATPGDALDSVR